MEIYTIESLAQLLDCSEQTIYSDYEDVEVEITEASAIGEDNEEYTIPDSDLDKITEQIARRL